MVRNSEEGSYYTAKRQIIIKTIIGANNSVAGYNV